VRAPGRKYCSHWSRWGFLARLALSALSWGSNDATTWRDFGRNIAEHGLLQIYVRTADTNHPPDPRTLAALCYRIAKPGAAAHSYRRLTRSVVPVSLQARADRRRCRHLLAALARLAAARGPVWAAAAAAIYAWNPLRFWSASITAHRLDLRHALPRRGVLIEDFAAWFWADCCWARRLMLKLIPVLLIPPLASTCPRFRQLTRFAAALAIGAAVLPPLLSPYDRGFIESLSEYLSYPCEWGIVCSSSRPKTVPAFAGGVGDMHERYLARARWLSWRRRFLLRRGSAPPRRTATEPGTHTAQ